MGEMIYDFSAGDESPNTMSYEDRLQFSIDILEGLDAPITAGNVHLLLAWMAKENTVAGGQRAGSTATVGQASLLGFNPLATTRNLSDEGSYGDSPINDDPTQNNGNPVMEYAGWTRGLRATLETLTNGYYDTLIAAFQAGTNVDEVLADPVIVAELNTWGSISFGSPRFGSRTGYSYNDLANDPSLGFPDEVPEVPEAPVEEEPEVIPVEPEPVFGPGDVPTGYRGDHPAGHAASAMLAQLLSPFEDLSGDAYTFTLFGGEFGDYGDVLHYVGALATNGRMSYADAFEWSQTVFTNFTDEMHAVVATTIDQVTFDHFGMGETTPEIPDDGDGDGDGDEGGLEDPTWDPLEEFGFMADFLNHPELGPIIRACAATGCDEQSFMDDIYGTDWWQQTENAEIQFQLMENWQPAQAAAMIDAAIAKILPIADQLDINIDPARLRLMARNSIVESWTTDDMNRKILSEASWVMGEAGGGSIGANMRVVGGFVDKYFIPHSPGEIEEFARKLWLGDETEGGLEAYFADLAKGQFPSLATHIDRGYTVKQIFDPYAQRIGNLLEIPASSVDFVNDQRFFPIIDHIGSENEHRPMTLWEMGQYVRTLDDWQYTNNAQTSARELADFIGKKFGSIG